MEGELTNQLKSQIISGGKHTQLVGTYLPPSTLEHLPDLEEALTHFQYQVRIVLRYLNANIGQS